MVRKNSWGMWIGLGLIVFGLAFMAGQILQVNIMAYLWPFFILAFGAAFFIGMVSGGRNLGALAVPGSVITSLGLILLFQNLFGLWTTWTYAWALIICGAGIGLIIFGKWSELPDLGRAGRVVAIVGLMLFLVFGLFFELGASLLGMRSPGGIFWPVALILVGIWVLFGRVFFSQVSGPVSRSTVAFSTPVSSVSGAVPAQDFSSVQVPAGAASSESVTGVRRLHFRALGDMTIVQGEREGLEIEASAVARERIRSEVHGNTLEIRYEQDWLDWLNPRFWNLNPIRYTLYVRQLEAVHAAGLGNLVIPGLLTKRFELEHSGTGNITVHSLAAIELIVHQDGLGNVEMDGQVERQEVEINGTGSYHARRLESRTATVRLSGLGSAAVRVSETLDARVTGLGSIEYYGSPRTTQQVSGMGSIRRIG